MLDVLSIANNAEIAALQNLARIHDALWVQRLFDGAHHVEFHRRLMASDFVTLHLSQAVLRTDRAA